MKKIFTPLALSVLLCGNLAYAAETGVPTYSLEAGTGHVVSVDAGLMFYDDGGPDANITPGFEGTVTFVPEASGKVLMINAEDFSIGRGALHVYSGREADAAHILGKEAGYSTTNGPSNLLSKAADGSLTVSFTANATASTLRGWAMAVTALDAVQIDVESVAVSGGAAPEVVRGAGDVPVAHLQLTVAGNTGTVAVEGVTVDFSGSTAVSDLAGARVYYTAANPSFAPVNLISDTHAAFPEGKAEFRFTSPLQFDEAGTYHFWVAADIAGEAEPGNTVSAAVTSVATSGSPVTIPEANTGSCTLKKGLAGTFRVGPSDNAVYHTIAEAVEALSQGVENTVLFMLEDGEYKENVQVSDLHGTTAAHPVVFSSLSGNRDKVVISGAGVLSDRGIVTVDNSSFVHLRNLTVSVPEPESSSAKPYSAILFRNGSRHCSVENCVVRADVPAAVETYLIRTADGGNVENTNCDYLSVKDSYFDGGYIALYLTGTGYTALPKSRGFVVANNVVANSYFKSVYLSDCEDFSVTGNSITSETARKGYNGIDIYRPHGAYNVVGNKVSIMQTTDCTGLYLRTGGGLADPARPALVANNVIAIPNAASTYTYGMMHDASIGNVVIAHNSVSVQGSSTLKSVYALAFSGNAPAEGAATICNNILQNTTASGPLRPWDASHYANMKFSGNIYYGGAEVMDGDGKTFDEYREATVDNTSLWMPVSFFSNTDLHLREVSDEMAMPRIDAVATDAEGTERPELTTPGAYEFATVEIVVPEIEEGYPAVGSVKDVLAVVNTRWSVGGNLYAIAVKASDAAPTREELLAARPVAAEAGIEIPYTFNFLDQLTAYKAYFLMVSVLGGESQIAVSPEFTTAETIDPLMVLIDWDEEPVNAGETIVLQAYTAGGKEPYSYTWLDQMNEPVGSSDLFTAEAVVNRTYRLEVTSADGQTARTKALVTVVAPTLAVATFDDLLLEAESKCMWDPYATEDTYEDAFFSGSFKFGNFPMVQYGAWSGYSYANETATAFDNNYDNQCRNVVGGGAANTANYGVAFMSYTDTRIHVSASDEGLVVPGVYVTNAAVTVEKILQGDAWCQKFTAENGDYMTLKVYGYDAQGTETGVVEVPLAEYRGEQGEAGGYVLSEWKWCDLSPLGAVNTLKLDYDSKQKEMVPAYVCFDQLGATDPLSALDAVADSGADIRLYIPAPDCLAVSGAEGSYTLRIYTADGVLHAVYTLNGASTVSIADIPAGACIAEAVTAGGSRSVLRFMKQ